MESRQRYIEEYKYDMDDEFKDFFMSLDPYLAATIADYIDNNLDDVPLTEHISCLKGGVVIWEEEPVFFVLEIVKLKNFIMSLSNISIITSDEYLDLINFNCYFKNE
tara:strand:- start:985 stop:1305 length:321 start_codon:yes stop_codon:yes gene_type:complete